ncbi:hypothetical protein FKM82_027882 [Ascaphus truei]
MACNGHVTTSAHRHDTQWSDRSKRQVSLSHREPSLEPQLMCRSSGKERIFTSILNSSVPRWMRVSDSRQTCDDVTEVPSRLPPEKIGVRCPQRSSLVVNKCQ